MAGHSNPSVLHSTSAQKRRATPPSTPPPPPPLSALSNGTPISKKISGSHTYSSGRSNRQSANFQLAEETKGLFLGAMPPSKFLDKFLPLSQDAPKCPDSRKAFARVIKKIKGKEVVMYPPFIAAVIPFAPKSKFVDTHVNPDTQRDKLAPDLSVYPVDDQPKGDAKTDFSKMGLFVEFKATESFDPFCDPADDHDDDDRREFCFEKDTDGARLVRGQLASYAAALAGSQFRVHTFCVLVCGEYARFIRWDRGGAIVTERFSYIQQPDFLAGFFWRYNHLDPRQQGYDTSVSSIDPENSGIQQIYFETLQKKNPVHHKFCILAVPDRDNAEDEKQFVVSFPPEYTARSPFGRGTRPMLAFDVEKGEIVFLKDYWRADVEGMDKEGEIYGLLESNHVPNIAPFGKGNDVRDHETVTNTLRTRTWACSSKEMVLLRHYRMTLDVVGRPLTSFYSSREFVSAIADAMEAHDHAFFRAHVLHRDISAGNILITDEGKGLLIDWDLCVKVDPNNGNQLTSGRRPDRTGTWQFMSAALLQNNKRCNELEDDRESCLHVLTWTALRYTNHAILDGDLKELLRPFDEVYEVEDGVKGGELKISFLLRNKIPEQVKFDGRPHLDELIAELTETFAVRYESRPSGKKNPTLFESVMDDRNSRVESLKKRDWLVKTFRSHLEAGSWPASDSAVKQAAEDGHRGKRKRTG